MAVLGKHAVMQQLLAEGTKYVFGNPGSTELAFMDGLRLQWLYSGEGFSIDGASYPSRREGPTAGPHYGLSMAGK